MWLITRPDFPLRRLMLRSATRTAQRAIPTRCTPTFCPAPRPNFVPKPSADGSIFQKFTRPRMRMP